MVPTPFTHARAENETSPAHREPINVKAVVRSREHDDTQRHTAAKTNVDCSERRQEALSVISMVLGSDAGEQRCAEGEVPQHLHSSQSAQD